MFILLFAASYSSAAKVHSVSYGRWSSIQLAAADESRQPSQVKVRPLVVDGRTKEMVIGLPRDITERTFVVQRVYKLNDSLPQDKGAEHWLWQLGSWLQVDRVTGKVQAISLPAFDPYLSQVSWFRDYAAYCGVADDGKETFAVISQLGRRKPLLKKALNDSTDSQITECTSPTWQRQPARVTFEPKAGPKLTYVVRSRAVDVVTGGEEEGEE